MGNEQIEQTPNLPQSSVSNAAFDAAICALNNINADATDVFQRIEREVFPLVFQCSPAEREDVFRVVERKFKIGKGGRKTLEAAFECYVKDILQAYQPEGNVDVIDELTEINARQRLESPEMFQLLHADFETLGLVGEKDNATVLYLVAHSSKTAFPFGAWVFGVSSGGKTSLVKRVLRLFPDDAKLIISSASTRAFEYLDPKMTEGRTVFIEEFEGLEQAVATIRLILSEGNATRAIPVQNPLTGAFETIITKAYHRFALITTTTRQHIDNETANRIFCLHIDQKHSHIKEVSAQIRNRYTSAHQLSMNREEEIIKIHHAMYRLLVPVKVDIPFATLIAFPDSQARHNRDLDKFLKLIAGVACVRQCQKTIEQHEHGNLVHADLKDYEIAHGLLPFALAEGLGKMSDDEETVLRLAIKYVKEVESESYTGLDTEEGIEITTRAIINMAKEAEIDIGDQTKVGQIMKSLDYQGFLESKSPSRQGSRQKYYIAKDVSIDESGDINVLQKSLIDQVSTPEELKARIEGRYAYRVIRPLPRNEQDNTTGNQDMDNWENEFPL